MAKGLVSKFESEAGTQLVSSLKMQEFEICDGLRPAFGHRA
ncbi:MULTISPECIES: hypothetical protein [Acaryochloris]|nr:MULTISPECIES: hypothetical protein [Acaryochloris]